MTRFTTLILTLPSLGLLLVVALTGCGGSGPAPDEMSVGRIHYEVSNGAVRLRWNYPSSGAATRFEVLRRSAAFGEENNWTELGTVDRQKGPADTDENYEFSDADDTLESGSQYIYQIVAVARRERVPRTTIQIRYNRERAPEGLSVANPIEQILEEIARQRPSLVERMDEYDIESFIALNYKIRQNAFPEGTIGTLEAYIQDNYEDLVVSPATDCALAFADWLVNEGGKRRASTELERQRDLDLIIESHANEAINEDMGPVFGRLQVGECTLITRLVAEFADLGMRANGRFGQVEYVFRVELRDGSTSNYIWAKEFRWSRTFRY